MDSFIEYMIRQKKKGTMIVKEIFIILAAVLVSLVLTFVFLILPQTVLSVWPLCIAGIFFAAYKIITSFNIEFEYILTNGELDVDKITHKKRRKRLITIHSKSFIEFGRVEDEKYKSHTDSEFSKVIDASANSGTYQDYYAIFFKNGQKIKLIFNPTQKMIDIFKIYAPRVVK